MLLIYTFGMGSLPDRPRAALAVTPHRAHQTIMLALDDAALARVCIAATAVAPEDRCRWLHDIAERLDPPRHIVNQRARNRRARERRRKGRRIYRLELSDRTVEGA